MRIAIVAAGFPPDLDGIGDYTFYLAGELAAKHTVQVFTRRGVCVDGKNFGVTGCFEVRERRSFKGLVDAMGGEKWDWLIFQYNPFAYGRWGLNLHLAPTLERIRKAGISKKVALMIHEPFVPTTSWKFRIMTVWQRWQLWTLGRMADRVHCSIQPWVEQFQGWFPKTDVSHLPVGANLEYHPVARDEARSALDINRETIVVGLFGTMHESRMIGRVAECLRAIKADGHGVLLLYVGPHGESLRQSLAGFEVLDLGRKSPSDVSVPFCAMDIYLAPFIDGVSTRRGSLMAALQHGVPTVGTSGALTDQMLLSENGKSMVLADVSDSSGFCAELLKLVRDRVAREQLGRNGRKLFEREFTWSRVAERLLQSLGDQDAEGSYRRQG